MNLKSIRTLKGLKQKELAESIGKNESFISRIEQYVYLPTPETARALCDALQVNLLDIYSREECDLLALMPPNAGEEECENSYSSTPHFCEPNTYRLSVRIPRQTFENLLTKEVLNRCGYRSITHWVCVCLLRLERQYFHITKNDKK